LARRLSVVVTLVAGCQRLRDAAYLWHFAPVGTKVVVTK
jgi:hypothetical protein